MRRWCRTLESVSGYRTRHARAERML